MRKVLRRASFGILTTIGLAPAAAAQRGEGTIEDAAKVARLVAEPARITMERGQTVPGHVFFTDFNSGLWAIKLRPPERPVPR